MINDDHGSEGSRLDVWLDISCLFRTRSEAQKAVLAGKIETNVVTVPIGGRNIDSRLHERIVAGELPASSAVTRVARAA